MVGDREAETGPLAASWQSTKFVHPARDGTVLPILLKEVDGKKVEGNWRSHQVPFTQARENAEHRAVLEAWMRSYRPEELFDDAGAPIEAIATLHPGGNRRMSANPHSNDGSLLRDLRMPDFRDHAVPVPTPGRSPASRRGCSAGCCAT